MYIYTNRACTIPTQQHAYTNIPIPPSISNKHRHSQINMKKQIVTPCTENKCSGLCRLTTNSRFFPKHCQTLNQQHEIAKSNSNVFRSSISPTDHAHEHPCNNSQTGIKAISYGSKYIQWCTATQYHALHPRKCKHSGWTCFGWFGVEV